MCPKHKYPIPTVPSASSYNSPSNQAAWLFSLVAVLNEVREFALPNFLGAQCAMASNFNVDSWSRYLDHYQDRVILDFLQYGWPVNYTSSVLASSTFHNHPSAAKNCDYLSSCTLKEFSYRSVFGAFVVILSTRTVWFLLFSVFQSVILRICALSMTSASPKELSSTIGSVMTTVLVNFTSFIYLV